MLMEGYAHCLKCGKEEKYVIKKITTCDTVGGSKVCYPYYCATCVVCGDEVYVPDLVDKNVKNMLEFYRRGSFDREGRRFV